MDEQSRVLNANDIQRATVLSSQDGDDLSYVQVRGTELACVLMKQDTFSKMPLGGKYVICGQFYVLYTIGWLLVVVSLFQNFWSLSIDLLNFRCYILKKKNFSCVPPIY